MPYVIGGQQVDLSEEPRNENGPVYVPLREVMEAIGGNLTWDDASKTAGAWLNGHHARIPNNSQSIEVDGQQKQMSVPTQMQGNDVWVPVEFFQAAFGVVAIADNTTNTVTVDTSAVRQAA